MWYRRYDISIYNDLHNWMRTVLNICLNEKNLHVEIVYKMQLFYGLNSYSLNTLNG